MSIYINTTKDIFIQAIYDSQAKPGYSEISTEMLRYIKMIEMIE